MFWPEIDHDLVRAHLASCNGGRLVMTSFVSDLRVVGTWNPPTPRCPGSTMARSDCRESSEADQHPRAASGSDSSTSFPLAFPVRKMQRVRWNRAALREEFWRRNT